MGISYFRFQRRRRKANIELPTPNFQLPTSNGKIADRQSTIAKGSGWPFAKPLASGPGRFQYTNRWLNQWLAYRHPAYAFWVNRHVGQRAASGAFVSPLSANTPVVSAVPCDLPAGSAQCLLRYIESLCGPPSAEARWSEHNLAFVSAGDVYRGACCHCVRAFGFAPHKAFPKPGQWTGSRLGRVFPRIRGAGL